VPTTFGSTGTGEVPSAATRTPADLPVQLVQRAARLGVGFQLLLRQLEIQGRVVAVTAIRARRRRGRLPSGSQDGSRYRSRLSRLGLDEQEFLFDADAARNHLSDTAPGSRLQSGVTSQQVQDSFLRLIPGGRVTESS
jgi:hypothetical protein